MDRADAPDGTIAVEVVYCPQPHVTDLTSLRLPATATAADAVRASGVAGRHGMQEESVTLGVWGRVCAPDQPLRDRDRVELYRALQVDPKEARRLRYKGRRAARAAPT